MLDHASPRTIVTTLWLRDSARSTSTSGGGNSGGATSSGGATATGGSGTPSARTDTASGTAANPLRANVDLVNTRSIQIKINRSKSSHDDSTAQVITGPAKNRYNGHAAVEERRDAHAESALKGDIR